MDIIIVAIALILVAGYFNGSMDYIKVNQLDSTSWMNKWEWTAGHKIPLTKRPWYYLFLFKPRYKEAFPYSSTVLVFLTDKWHFAKWVVFTCYELFSMLILWHFQCFEWYFIPVGILGLKTIRGTAFSFKYDK